MATNDPATALLLQLLANSPNEPAARLKQRLSAALVDKGLGPFDQKAAGFKTFQDYLRSLGNLISIEHKSGSDMIVSLGTTAPLEQTREPAPSPALKTDVWLAFTNPDPTRARFFSKSSHRVVHFPHTEVSTAVSADPADFIAIPAIDAATHNLWMREFLAEVGLSSNPLLSTIADTPYSSAVNTAFNRALGKQSADWRTFRTHRVFAEADAWAAQHGVESASLRVTREPTAPTASAQSMSPRLRATKLLESFTDQELVETVIPILAASALVKSRS